MGFDLLVGSDAFWARASEDIAKAHNRVLIQAMTFEADAAGNAVSSAILNSTARDRRVLVDDFSRHVINDHFVRSPFSPSAVRAEAASTRQMFSMLDTSGVAVKVTNPVGRNPFRYAVRNHKKLILADDVAFIGGINFSDHNFEWHDLMLRIEGVEEAAFFACDFDSTWDGNPVAASLDIAGSHYSSLNGFDNLRSFKPLFDLIESASERIELVSAYPTFPFVCALAAAARRGIEVDIYTPWPNNKQVIRDYLLPECAKSGMKVHLLPEMTHLKAILVDRQKLVLGSCNFDFVSYSVEEEYLALLSDAELITDFVARVIEPGRAAALTCGTLAPSRWGAAKAALSLRVADQVVKRLSGVRRTAVNWGAA